MASSLQSGCELLLVNDFAVVKVSTWTADGMTLYGVWTDAQQGAVHQGLRDEALPRLHQRRGGGG